MSIILQSTAGGQITLQEPTTVSNFTQTIPAVAGSIMVSGNQPAFKVFLAQNQVVSSATDTKVTLTNKIFDTASRFNNTGSTVGNIPPYAFLPEVAGYYQINATIGAFAGTALTYNYIQIRKNGTSDTIAIYPAYSGTTSYGAVSSVIFLNGVNDYVELFVQLAGTGTLGAYGGSLATCLSGCLVRAA